MVLGTLASDGWIVTSATVRNILFSLYMTHESTRQSNKYVSVKYQIQMDERNLLKRQFLYSWSRCLEWCAT